MATQEVEIDLGELSQKQTIVFNSPAREILFGGALGPGKSHLLRILAVYYAIRIPYIQIFLFRRTKPELLQSHLEGPFGLRALLAPYVNAKKANVTEDGASFDNGARIHLCHCQDAADVYRYNSAEMHILLIDEATSFTEDMVAYLRTRVRAFSLKVPEEFKEKIPFIVYGSNPGQVGHQYFKRNFVDPVEPLTIWTAPKLDGGLTRQFVPAILSDNKWADPSYADQVQGLKNEELKRAYLEGDWNINLGCFFPEFNNHNVIKPFDIPSSWTRIRAMDWGSVDPCAVIWMTITPEDWVLEEEAPEFQLKGFLNEVYCTKRRIVPKKSVIIYREWYIADSRDKGIKLGNFDLARGIRERELPDERILYGVTGRDSFMSRGGPSIAQQLNTISTQILHGNVLFTRMADIKRVPGWQEFRSKLVGHSGYPQLYVFSNCRHTIRLIPAMQYETKAGGVTAEDAAHEDSHIGDAIRYGLMSWITPNTLTPSETKVLRDNWTLDALWAEHESMRAKGLID